MMNLNRSCEPMDIDLSAHSVSEMDISYNNSANYTPSKTPRPPSSEPSIVKKEYIDIASPDEVRLPRTSSPVLNLESDISDMKKRINVKPKKQTNNIHLDINQYTILFVIFVVFPITISFIFDIKCTEEINISQLRDTLSVQLFGQSTAIGAIIDTLGSKDGSKILFFYGGTGVGKTYTASLLMENFGSSSNVYHYTMPSFMTTFSTEFMLGLIMCKNSIVIVDDLTENDIIMTQISELVNKSEYLGKNVTIILIYNCERTTDSFVKKCDEAFHKTLLKNYLDVKVFKKFVKFEPLTEGHLRQCIEKELGNRKINKNDFEKIEKNFNVTLDGCKGVHTKMKFLNIL